MKRIPRTVWLAPGHSVTVKMEPPSMIEARYGEKGKVGFYDHSTKTIHIDKTISLNRKWTTYRHELVHAIIDIDLDVNGGI